MTDRSDELPFAWMNQRVERLTGFSARHALLTDAVATTSPEYCLAATIYNVRQCFGFTATTADLIGGLTPAPPI